MQMFTIEMLPNLCRHCAKHHLNKQQQQQQQSQQLDRNREHFDTTHFHKSIWLLLTIARKKLNQIRNQSHNEDEQNENHNATNENTMSLLNVMANHNKNNNDQSNSQCNNQSLVIKAQSIHGKESTRSDAQPVGKMSILTNDDDDVNTSFSNGALIDVHASQTVRNIDIQQQKRQQESQVTPSLDETTAMLRSRCMPSSSTQRRCIQCRCENSSSDANAQQPQMPVPIHSDQMNSNLNLNVHETEAEDETNKNPNSYSEQKNHTDRLATNNNNKNNSSDSDRCIAENDIDPYGLSRSVRTFSANYSNNHPRKNAYVNHRWPYAISSTMNFSHVLLICIAFVVFGVRNAMVMADDTPANASQLNLTENGICSSKDIRNSVKNFNELKGCRVIEGFLMITLIDKYNETDYDGLEFPLLTEVTEFLLVYRVNGLKSLGKLFPNLRIIRGNVLIHDFSFIIFEMMHLQEIGLTSLIKIPRGSVRIEKNPALCFVESIDWSLITSSSKENIFSNNKAVNECPTCPGGNKNDNNNNEQSKSNTDTIVCPEASGRRLCWNHQQCQILCPAKCGNLTCNENGECCDESCLGCSNENPNVCLSCRYLSIGNLSNRQCVQKCPANTFAHENRRCVTKDECRAIKKPVFVKYDFNLLDYPYIPREGKCATDCPSNFYPDGLSGKRECIPCEGSCKKECPPGNIDSISTAQRYRGCTHIKGPLAINIRNQGGHNIVRELETFLSDIEVIEGPLQIIRSYPLLSLGFFKKLRVVEGDVTGKEKYGLKVLENQNLQALFNQNVTIEHGRMFFHFNPKLCMNIIEEFKSNVVDLRNVSKLPIDEVAPNSNGDKTACNVTELQVEVKRLSHNVVVMELQPMPYEDERQLLGYLLYYMPAPYQNVTMFDGRDACGGDGWQVDDVPDNNRNSTPVSIIATHLKPYTQYAYFIRTYTVASEQRGGITKIKYFRTKPYKPEPVTKLSVAPNGSSEIIVKWGPPVHAHGNLTKYIIKSFIVPDDPQLLELRNYCNEPLGIEPKTIFPSKPNEVIKEKKEKQDTTLDSGCSCDNEEGREKSKFSDEDAEQLIEFEDELHNTVYVRQENLRRRRDVSSQMYMNDSTTFTMIKTRHRRSSNSSTNQADIFPVFPSSGKPDSTAAADDKVDKMDPTNTYYTYLYREVNASVFTLTLNQLKHYSYYSITVKACREGEGDNCGNEMIAYQRTGKIEGADDVTFVAVEKLPASNHSTGVRLIWNEPENPNGMIVSYNIRYQRVDIEHAKYQDICITQNLYREQGKSHIITDLVNGNYSFTVVANSLAGANSRWSKPVFYNVDEPTLSPAIIALIVILVILVLCGIGALAWFYRRKYGPPDSRIKIIASVNPEYVSMQYTPDEWEIPREKIIQLNELGQGSFGMVYEGVVLNLDRDHERIRCAIKTVNENATDRERINFLKEAAVMKAFDTHHVVRLLGVVSRGQPVLVIMELMVNGDLKGFLRSHRPETGNDVQPPTLRQILQMSIEIADGMAYLAAKKFVHRDLAARNCMVAEDMTVKIGDFGMTRDIYETDYYRKGTKGLLPVRWMAPESLKDGVFSSSSDVFSFGIVLWEMATLASQPYQGLSNDQVLRYVIDGGVMERPENCPERIYTLMCRCWQHRPSARPTFMQIVSMLLDEAKPNFRQVSFYHSQAGQELLQLPQHQLLEVVDVRTPLRAEEENFSVGADDEDDPEDPNSFLMEKRNISHQSASASGPSNSPLRAENSSTIPDISKTVPKNSSNQLKLPLLSKASQHQPSTSMSFFNTFLPSSSSNKPTTNSASALASRTIHCDDSEQQDQQQQQQSHPQLDSSSDSTAILMPNNSTNLFGRNGIKSNFNQFARMTFGDSANANNTGDKSNNDYCNTSTGDAKAYKLLNSLS